MSYKTMPEIANDLRALADVVETGAGKALSVLYIDERGDIHRIVGTERGEESTHATELHILAYEVVNGRPPNKKRFPFLEGVIPKELPEQDQ